jgi:hypothetical protein
MRLQGARIKGLSAGLLSCALLGLLLGASANAKAQEGREEAKPPQQEEPKQDEAKPKAEAPKDKDMKAPREQEPAKGQEARPANDKANEMKPEKAQERPQDNRGGDHAAAQQGRRIPDQKFHASFGREHTFHVQKTVVVEGQPRFQYGGFWFALSNPWPVGWDYNDDCYVDYVDGEYVLIDLRHPGAQVVLLVVG